MTILSLVPTGDINKRSSELQPKCLNFFRKYSYLDGDGESNVSIVIVLQTNRIRFR